MKTKNLVYIGIFAAVTAVLSQIAVPFGNVPVSLGTFAVFLCGSVLSPAASFAAQCVYLTVGLIGLPVYANFMGGVGILFGMTGGYLMSYPFMAFITSISVKKAGSHRALFSVLGMLCALILCYTLGTLWFILVTGSPILSAIAGCVLPFLPFDLIKIVLAAILGNTLRKALTKAAIR